MTATEIILNDPEHKARRFRQCQTEMEYFSNQLFKIFCWMPQKISVYPDKENGNVVYEIEPEWQKMIDKVKENRDEYLKKNYPEFYAETIP